ncbi:MAG: peroxiredoxin [Polyangiaceae bacterium]
MIALAVGAGSSACAKESSGGGHAGAATSAEAQDKSALVVGSPAPNFVVRSSDGTELRLAALKGKPVVVYFYPKDETPGCTKEACAFRDAWDSLSKTGVVLIGVSADDDASHQKFAEHHRLPFKLVSDPHGDLAKSFGVPTRMGFTSRQSIVIDENGNVKRIYRDVDVTKHAAEIAADLGVTKG